MIRRAFRYPTSGEHGVGAVLVGGGLLLFATGFAVFGLFLLFIPVLLAPVFYVALRGYYVRVIRWTTRHPGSDPPPFDDWNQLLVDGLQATIVSCIYWIPAVVLFVLAAVVGGITVALTPDTPDPVAQSVAGLLVLAGILYLVVMAYVLPAAVATFAYHDDFFAAFRLGPIARGVFTEDYVVGWIFTVVYRLVALPVVLLLSLVLVGFFLNAFVGIGVRHVYGVITRDAFDFEPMDRPPSTGEEPTASDPPAADTVDSDGRATGGK